MIHINNYQETVDKKGDAYISFFQIKSQNKVIRVLSGAISSTARNEALISDTFKVHRSDIKELYLDCKSHLALILKQAK